MRDILLVYFITFLGVHTMHNVTSEKTRTGFASSVVKALVSKTKGRGSIPHRVTPRLFFIELPTIYLLICELSELVTNFSNIYLLNNNNNYNNFIFYN